MNESQAVNEEIALEDLKRRYAVLEAQHRAMERNYVSVLGRAETQIWQLKCRLRVIKEMCEEAPNVVMTHGQKNGYFLAVARFAEKGDNILLRHQIDQMPGDLDEDLPF